MSPYERCGWCQKIVKHKPFFGTLHICLTEEERRQRYTEQRSAMQQQYTAKPIPAALLRQDGHQQADSTAAKPFNQ